MKAEMIGALGYVPKQRTTEAFDSMSLSSNQMNVKHFLISLSIAMLAEDAEEITADGLLFFNRKCPIFTTAVNDEDRTNSRTKLDHKA